VTQATVKKKIKRVRDIENITKTKWIKDGAGGIALIVSSSVHPSTGPGLKIAGLERVGSLGLFRWSIWRVGDMTSPWVSTWMAGIELSFLVTVDGISMKLPRSGNW